jgi:hypothetical protein
MLYPRALAEELGGYDPGFSPVWFDDVDLSLSMRRLGLKVFFLSGVDFTHHVNLRNERQSPPERQGYVKKIRRTGKNVLPERLVDRMIRFERRDTDHPPHELKRLRHHYDYWREKWGFDLINPDLDEVLRRYGDTEVCWAYDAKRRQAGCEIIASWEALKPAPQSTP